MPKEPVSRYPLVAYSEVGAKCPCCGTMQPDTVNQALWRGDYRTAWCVACGEWFDACTSGGPVYTLRATERDFERS